MIGTARPLAGAWVRLTAFAGLCALVGWRYAGIEAHPPALRVLAVVLLMIAAAAALTALGAARRRQALLAGAALMAILLVAALLAAGVPARLLAPGAWGTLVRDVHRGLRPVATTIWPYAGRNPWTRVDILLGLVVLTGAAATLGGMTAAARNRPAGTGTGVCRLLALGLLLTVYVIGVLDANGGAPVLEGLLLLALLAAWLWLPDLARRRRGAALAWLAVAAVLGAGAMAGLAGGRAWFDYRAWNLLGSASGRTVFAWDQTYGPIPWSRSERTMFTVRAASPGLWKVTTLDRFDGLRFLRSGTEGTHNEDLPLPLDDRWYQFATFSLAGLSSRLLPTEQGTTAGVDFRRRLQYAQDGTVRTVGRPLGRGDRYTVLSYVPAPIPAQLRAAPRRFPAAYLRYTAFDLPAPGQSGLRVSADRPPIGEFATSQTVGALAPGRMLPPSARRRILASPYAGMYRLARRLAAGARSTYEVVLRAQNYLQANYAYSEQTPRRRYPLEAFLFSDRVGYCQQFSGAMALILRMDGIPARVAAGFLPGAYDGATGTYDVRGVDAHSWVEVYFSGIGWVAFNPTPARTVGPPQRSVFASESVANPAQAIAATIGGTPPVRRTQARLPRRARGGVSGAEVALLALGGLALIALSALAVRWLAGNRRLRRSLSGDTELATQELVRALRRLGYGLPATTTLAQIEGAVRLHGGAEAARYVALLREHRYGLAGNGRATLRDRRRLRHALTCHLGLDDRLRGHWALPPGTLAWRVPRPAQPAAPGGP